MTSEFALRWYVVQTRPRAEGQAVAHLNRQGFATYLPRYLKRRRHARRVDTVATPLFPRYLFVSVDMQTQRWRSIRSTLGVSQLVCNGDSPAILDDRTVASLKQRENECGFIQLDQRPRFQPGEQVRSLDGAFIGSLGLYEGMTDQGRITILLDLLGRKVRVMLDADFVAAA
jgi:transcriptional antiterminator RfaH